MIGTAITRFNCSTLYYYFYLLRFGSYILLSPRCYYYKLINCNCFRCWKQLYLVCLKGVICQKPIQTRLESIILNYIANFGVSCKCFWRKCCTWHFRQLEATLQLLSQLQHPTDFWMLANFENFIKDLLCLMISVNCMLCTPCGHHNHAPAQCHANLQLVIVVAEGSFQQLWYTYLL